MINNIHLLLKNNTTMSKILNKLVFIIAKNPIINVKLILIVLHIQIIAIIMENVLKHNKFAKKIMIVMIIMILH